MARKKSKSDQVKVAITRLAQDEDVQKQIRTAALRLREAWGRASGRPASKAVSDKKIYSKVRDAATSLTAAAKTLRKKPEPPKRTGRKVAVGAAVAGGAAYAVAKKRGGGDDGGGSGVHSPAPTGPVATSVPPTPVA